MHVERVRSFEVEPVDSSRERSNGKASGFSALMDSVLGPAGEAPKPPAESREARSEKPSPGRDPRPTTSGPRKTARGEKNEKSEKPDETSAEASAEAGSTRADEEIVETAPKGEQDDPAREEAPTGTEAELLAGANAPGWEVAAPLAVPVLEALARSGAEETVQDGEGIIEAVVEVDGEAVPVFDGLPSDVAAQADAELAQATSARDFVVDPKTREGFLAALAQARAAGADESSEVESREVAVEASSAEIAPALAEERSAASPVRPAAILESVPRAGTEAVAIGAGEGGRSGAGSQGDLGSDGFSRGRGDAAPQPAPIPVERASAESSAVASAAIEGATAGIAETAPGSSDPTASLRLDAPAPTPPTRAPELPSTMQPGRTLPTAAPDAIAVQADWLATRGGGTARLVLNPPELGEIAIRVTVRQQAVEVVMVAQTALAHSMAEDQGDRLSQAFASRDLRLEQFEVRRGDPSDSSGTGQFGSSDAGARERDRAQDQREVDRGGFGGQGLRRGGAGGEAVAPPPRVASNGRAAGIDLRI
jgi:flagellar hook-length control protein FliK